MPALHDYDANDEQQGSATGAPKQAATQPHEVQEYTPWSSFVSANQDVSQREAGKLSGQVGGDVSRAQGELQSAQDSFNAGINGTNGTLMKPKASASAPTLANTVADASTPDAADTNPRQRKQSPAPQPALSAFGGSATKLGAAPPSDAPVSSSQADTASPSSPQAQPAGALQSSQAQPAQPTTSNPWASFLPDAPATVSGVPAAPSSPGAAPTAPAALGPPGARNTSAGAPPSSAVPTASKDLEAAAGPKAWSSLLGDTLNATDEAHALGSETGVQGLLQRNQVGPVPGVDPLHASAFDAALINGQGQADFGKIAQQYGGNQLEKNVVDAEQGSQEAWKKFQGDHAAREDFAHRQRGPTLADPVASPTDSKASSYDASKDDHMDHELDDMRDANAAGWNATGAELGFYNPKGEPATGAQWVQDLPRLTAVGGGQPGSTGWNIAQAISGAAKTLGMPQGEFNSALSKMSARELGDFWAFGVVPQWMGGTGQQGGWNSPFMQRALQYGSDGGMWNAITNTWKNGAITAASAATGGPVGAVVAGGKAVGAGFSGGKGISN